MAFLWGRTRTSSGSSAPAHAGAAGEGGGAAAVTVTEPRICGSQGVVASTDHSCAMIHFTTSPPRYYEHLYGLAEGVNMDRGGFGQSTTGTNFGCVFDGVTAGGVVNAHAAQAFAEVTLTWLGRHSALLTPDPAANQKLFDELFAQCTHFSKNPGGERQAEGGSATAVVAVVCRHRGKLWLVGATVGDAACIILHPDKPAEVVSAWNRSELDPRNSGGELVMSVGVQGRVSTFAHPISEQSLIIVTTDGVTDNVARGDLTRILPLIACSDYFQTKVSDAYPASRNHLPTYQDLQIVCATAGGFSTLSDVKPALVCSRITNYLEWVTRAMYQQEQQYYGLEMALRKVTTMTDGRQAAKVAQEALQDVGSDGSLLRIPPPPVVEDTATDVKKSVELLSGYLQQLRESRKHNRSAGKTDDAMIVCFRPLQRSSSGGGARGAGSVATV